MQALEVCGLVKTYHSVAAVRGISFAVRPGEIFALVGPNGAGKSTTLKMAATILTPTSGSASVFGLDLRRDAARVREIISYLPEEAGAYKALTGRQYLDFMSALACADEGAARRAAAFAQKVCGLEGRLDSKVKSYSKGMTRKLLLARAVMTGPRLAILDEPTSGLDVINAMEIRRMLKGMAAQGMSILLSSHNMLEIESLADRVAIMDHGALLDSGPVAELKARHAAADLEEVFARIVS